MDAMQDVFRKRIETIPGAKASANLFLNMWETLSNIAEATSQEMGPEITEETNLGIMPEVLAL